MPTYSELLKHPYWQRKRLEILEAAEFACYRCDEKEKTLHVHHLYYLKGHKPWEYPDEALQVLCGDCHLEATSDREKFDNLLAKFLSIGGDLDLLSGYIAAVSYRDFGKATAIPTTFEMAEGVSDAYHMKIEEVIDTVKLMESKKR